MIMHAMFISLFSCFLILSDALYITSVLFCSEAEGQEVVSVQFSSQFSSHI